MYGCDSWTIRKAEHQRIDAFELWCWRRLSLRVFRTGRSNQSILKEIKPEYLSEGLFLKLKLQFFGHLMQKANSSWSVGNDPDAGKDWGQEKKRATEAEMVGWHHWLNGHEFEQTPGDSEEQGNLVCCSPLGHKESDKDWATEQQQNIIWFKNINLEEKSTKSPRD